MPFEKYSTNFSKPEDATPEAIEKFYQFKILLRTAKDRADIVDLCKDAGIEMGSDENIQNTALFRKQTLEHYLALHFSLSSSAKEQEEKIKYHVERLTSYLQQEGARSSLWVGGSYGTGKIRSPQSDIDLFIGLPKLLDADERAREFKIFQGLENINFVIAQNIAPVEDILSVFETGKGLARLSGMTKDGIEVDFHGIGVHDLEAMDKLLPGFVERIRKVKSYEEDRTSFIGNKKVLPKPGGKLFHYKDVGGEMFKGFYPDNFSALGELVYDPDGKGKAIQDALWRALVKGFIFHNQAYKRKIETRGVAIRRAKILFPNFLKTLYYQKPEDYSKNKLKSLEQRYNHVVDEIAERYHLTIE